MSPATAGHEDTLERGAALRYADTMELPPPGDAPFEPFLLKGVPHAEALGMMLVEFGDGFAVTRMPYAPHLAGNPETGVLHGGVITSLLDHSCGLAVQSRVRSFGGIATLDLRIDYMKPATAGEDIHAFVECYRVTKSIAFVRGVAYHTDRSDPIAAVTAAFMLNTAEIRKPS